MLLNQPRAIEVMERHGLDGLVAAFPENIYYLTGYYGPMLLLSRNYTLYAVLPRDPDRPAALIMPSSGAYHLEHMPTWVPNVVPFSIRVHPRAIPPRDFASELEEIPEGDEPPFVAATNPTPYPVRDGATFNERDLTLLARHDRYRGQMEPTALYALRRALRDAGLDRAKFGFDDPRVGGWLNGIGLEHLTCVDALNVFKEIRMVKSSAELDIFRTGGRIAEATLNEVIDAIEPGLPLDALADIHAMALAKRGGRSLFIIANIRGLATGEVEPNELIKLDAVSTYKEYRGDLGRSVICGEATPEMLRRNRAVMRGLQIAYENMRPAVRAADITALTLKAVARRGLSGLRDRVAPFGRPRAHRPSDRDRSRDARRARPGLPREHGVHARHAVPRVRLGHDACRGHDHRGARWL